MLDTQCENHPTKIKRKFRKPYFLKVIHCRLKAKAYMQYISDIRNILPLYMYPAIRLQIACPDYKYSLYNGHLLSCGVLDAIPHLTAVMEDLCDIHSNTDTLKSYFFSCQKVFIFISSLSFKCITKKNFEKWAAVEPLCQP